MAGYIIQVKDLVSKYGQKVVHRGLNLGIKEGELYAIVGGSGAGKSTLLKTLLLLKKADGGKILFKGKDISNLSEKEIEDIKKRIGVMFQFSTMLSSLTVGQNIIYVIKKRYSIDYKTALDMAKLKLKLVGLSMDTFYMYPSELSGGMKKKAALAVAMSTDPDILFLDEPTSGLDPISAEEFDKLVRTLVDTTGTTIVQITHDLGSLMFVDTVAVISKGLVVYEGNPQDLTNVNDDWIQSLTNTTRFRRLLDGK
ncbi:MAG: ABC transporter ATP-binding protein [Sulfurihydrogenibium sp.]|jgi:phospholipid/cholesterol/gamma-HCH transport system ATP-binding protein|uniref:ATP-binding cassette domain-containing protein n=1 Tax=Sulfurihydrogenibium azorense TaxID=309806 RepID=A0A831YC70_9AQUI|nr:MAG: ABC transporter [Sulfurihydrogenibium sp.]PMP76082.1 MAG: ABC transporter [Sulfurihydrogenibium sp.]HEV09191.1 ATP-binding cassette domain-containing protein [Sulfurihydrogenibium azorense]